MNNDTEDQGQAKALPNYMAGLFQTHAENFSDSMKAGVMSGVKSGGIVIGTLACVVAITATVVLVASAFNKQD